MPSRVIVPSNLVTEARIMGISLEQHLSDLLSTEIEIVEGPALEDAPPSYEDDGRCPGHVNERP